MKKAVTNLIAKEIKLKVSEVENLVEIPPRSEMGDFAFPCFSLAKKLKKSPMVIAEDLAKRVRKKLPKEISNVDFKEAYVNFFIDKKILAEGVLAKAKKKNFGSLNLGKGKNVGIEYPSPNTNKALHVGHLRNIAVGEAVSNMVKNARSKIFHLNLFNDRGILISKSMIGYEQFAKGKTPKTEGIKGDKFVGDLYTEFSKKSAENPELEKNAIEKLRLWENEDKNTRELWKKLNGWVYSGIQETFDRFGLSPIDKNYYESKIYKEGRDIVERGLGKGLFKKKDNAVIVDLEKEKLGEKVLLRGDGTSVYITQDLFLAEQKIKDFNLDSSYYIVGCDQEYHFKVLFSILERLGIKKDWKHLSYGMVSLPSGKMKSREGTAVFADDLIDETASIAKKGIVDRSVNKVGKKDLEDRSLKIALAAIKYALLKVDIYKKIVFNPKESLSFEGDTGPYLLYSYARASSINRKVKSKKPMKIIDLKNSEIALLKKIDGFEDVVKKAYENLAPNLVANYCFELAQMFNEFYHSCPVLGSDEEGFRLKLVDAFRVTLKKGLTLLGIETIEEM